MLTAQHDVSIALSTNTLISEVGDTTTFNLRAANLNLTDIDDLSVQIISDSSLDFIEALTPEGTDFNSSTGMWHINSQLTGDLDSLNLNLKFRNNSQGTHFVIAEVFAVSGFDYNSFPQNGNLLEDDMAVACVSVPIILGLQDTVELLAPTLTNEGGHQWSRTTETGVELVAQTAFYAATEPGIYRYSNSLSQCNIMSCCDIILQAEMTDPCGDDTDNIPPVFTNIPADAAYECGENIPYSEPTANDVNGVVSVDFSEIITDNDCSQTYTLTRTWTATDACENISSVQQTIIVQDNTPPVITPTHPLLVGLNSGDEITVDCSTPFILNPTSATATDNCDDNVAITVNEEAVIIGDCLTDGFLVWMNCYFEATDACGNTSQFFVKIKITDTTAPIFTEIPADTTIACTTEMPPIIAPTVFDNCNNITDITMTFSETQEGSGCSYQFVRTWTATDDCENIGTVNQIITVQDDEAPVIIGVPDNQTVDLSAGEIIPNTPTNVNVSDNCASDIVLSFNENQTGTACAYQIIRTWTATDDCNNTTTETQVINVSDAVTDIGINTTPEDCESVNGTADLTPESYSYIWSNGLTGANQTGLSAGIYSVTATDDSGCNSVSEVVINQECDCIEFAIIQELYTDATCNENNGSAVIIPEGEISDYTYTWIPNVGTTDATDNSQTNLPAGDYLVIILYQGNPDCEEKVEFTIDNDVSDCSNILCEEEVIDAEIINISVVDPEREISVCLPVSLPEANNYNITIDGNSYNETLQSCNQDTSVFYSYTLVVNGGNGGPYNFSWEYPNGNLTGTVNDMNELTAVMDAAQPDINWTHQDENNVISAIGLPQDYGKLIVTHIASDVSTQLAVNYSTFSVSTEILLQETGEHIIIFENPATGCTDTINVIVTQNFTSPAIADFLRTDTDALSYNCEEREAVYCIDIPFEDFINNYDVINNGLSENATVSGCNFILSYRFNYSELAGFGESGPYDMSWTVNDIEYNAEAAHIYDILVQMNLWDTQSTWTLDESLKLILNNSENDNFGALIITQQSTGVVSNISKISNSIAHSTQLRLEEGINELVIRNLTDNTEDKMTVRAACVTPEYVENTIEIGDEDEMCFSTEELTGEVVSLENICADEENASAELEEIDGIFCISCIGISTGTQESCFVICDEYGICDTTYLKLNVIERSNENQENGDELVIYSGFSPNGDNVNETFQIKGLQNYPDSKLTIFNRWGNRVYHSDDYASDWDGSHNNELLPDGTYFYILELNERNTKSGYLSLLR